jgi:hypothetical protein
MKAWWEAECGFFVSASMSRIEYEWAGSGSMVIIL